MATDQKSSVRVDKWLWAARFFKTRGLAQTALKNGRVLIGGERVKLARSIAIDDEVRIRIGDTERTIIVRGISANRGSAPIAQQLYEETPSSVIAREEQRAKRKLFMDPASAIAAGRPTKRDRRLLREIRGQDTEQGASSDE
jgi:ribosome-associated heat shock protein Hsp15